MSDQRKRPLPPKHAINTRLTSPVRIEPSTSTSSSQPHFPSSNIIDGSTRNRQKPPKVHNLFQRRRNAQKLDHPLGFLLRNRNAAASHIPQRTTKTSQKLVLLPEDHEVESFDEDESVYEDLIRSKEAYTLLQAEKFSRDKREELGFPRVTAYCICEAFNLSKVRHFLKHYHEVRTKKYDEALYASYNLPLQYGITDNCRVRSGPSESKTQTTTATSSELDASAETLTNSTEPYYYMSPSNPVSHMYKHAELFIFDYGVVVFWNFSERQEKDVLADLTFASNCSLMTKPLSEEECEIEDLHFHYAPNTKRPRIYNDMIHIPSADVKTKLAMSHALAQSVKLSHFEFRMDETMNSALVYPKKLALYGELGLGREQVAKMSGKLFQLRVDVNLISNVLDTPDLLWNNEPLLLPLYTAFCEYLEIGPRTQVLNNRCKVISDMLEIFAESSADKKMNRITLIIISLMTLFVIFFAAEILIRRNITKGTARLIL
ncbi:Sad1 interacting factor 3 [Schizosaccharomyces japonicus yFS275]|uniref:Sad1 interacting factor 3 n=1 Tax=Schizosaccharomyces japonicus (strain yFS275 / FY16936) TaxID=402676 RepID=B6JZY5_SCHJY|nr:Sad1 interacting factor 3 [Schizosaccharomyces japonicus yFS275]EEB06135.1 Sad1 interacting factor 3 [Schizosaccharomyces japonicus yFS275]